MLGKNHVAASVFIKFAADAAYRIFSPDVPVIVSYFYEMPERISPAFWNVAVWPIFALGVLFPDIDSRESLIGRILYIPIEHRTWTHCWLPVALLVIFSSRFIWLRVFVLGYSLHIAEDAFSYGGIRFFYPLNVGVRGIYRTGKPSEQVFTAILIGASIAILYFLSPVKLRVV